MVTVKLVLVALPKVFDGVTVVAYILYKYLQYSYHYQYGEAVREASKVDGSTM
jgi:hypothetical protein